jgi:hypothetical protein
MNSGNQLLSIAGIFLLQLLLVNANKHNIERMQLKNTNTAVIAASSVAQSMIEEIQQKAFDENTVSKSVLNDAELSGLSNLGPDTGELNNTQFDDIDDYNGYVTEDSLENIGKFQVSVKVNYRINMHTDQLSSKPSFVKVITVSVNNFSLSKPLRYYQVIAY